MGLITLDSKEHGAPLRLDGWTPRPKYIHLAQSLGFRADSNETAILQRALDYVETRATEVMYTELRAARFVPAIDVPLGAKTYTFAVLDRVGRAKRTGQKAGDLPRANVTLSENTSAIAGYGAKYSYTTDELRSFQYWNSTGRGLSLNLDTERADTAMQMIAREIDQVIAFGDPDDTRIKGFTNSSLITPATAAYDLTNVATTYDQMLSVLLALANNPVVTSKEVFVPDTILLPTAHLLAVQAKQNAQGTRSVLQAFNDAMQAAGRKVTVESWPLLATADTAGTGPRAISYVRNTRVVGSIVPALFIAQPPQAVDLEWHIPCEGLCGGAVIKQPLGVYYMDLTPSP